MGTFAGSWLPLQAILLCKALGLYPFSVTNISFQIGSHVLAYSNSCVNPILYAYFSSPFREAFIKLFFKKQNSNTRSDQTAVTLVRVTVREQKRGGGFAIGVGFQVQKGDRHELKREESEKKANLSAQSKLEGASSPGSPSNGATLKTPNHGLSDVSTTKVQETCLGEDRTTINGAAAIDNGMIGTGNGGVLGGKGGVLGGHGGVLGGNVGVLEGKEGILGGGNGEVLGVDSKVLGGSNGVLRSNTGFVSI